MMLLSRLLLPLLALGVGAFKIVKLESDLTPDNPMENGLSLHRDSIGASRGISTRIVGGTDAPDGRYPYYTFVEINTNDGIFICSATLIWEDILLTAAHCILDLEEAGLDLLGVSAFVGLEDQRMRDQAQFRQVELFVPNPNYNTITLERDVAIFKLVDPILTIQPLQIEFNPSVPLDGQRVDVFGFGETSEGGALPDELQTVEVQVIPFADCNDANSYDGIINDAVMICAGRPQGGADSCNGDSGSPLIISGTDFRTDVLVGLVSFGSGCAQPTFPGVYTRLSSVGIFIFNQICAFSDNPPNNCGVVESPTFTPPVGTPAPNQPNLPTTSPAEGGDDDDDDDCGDDDDDDDDNSQPMGMSSGKGGKGMGGMGMGKGMGGKGKNKKRELERRVGHDRLTRNTKYRGD